MLNSNYMKSVANARRERREKLRVLSELTDCCGTCAYYDGGDRRGHCTNSKNAYVRYLMGHDSGEHLLRPIEVTVTQGCELHDKHKVEVREPNAAVEAALDAISGKYRPKVA